jgi:hypothetical protein
MPMNISRYLFACLLVLSTPSAAQVVSGSFGLFEETGLFGNTSAGYTARITGIGGAITALGGDGSSITTNPAGLGFYNRSEVSFTPMITAYRSSTTYFNTESNAGDGVEFSIPNFSVVFNLTKDDIERGKFRGGSIGFSASTINDFNQDYILQTDMAAVEEQLGQGSSILDFFVDQAGTQDFNELSGLTGMAFDQYLISPFFDETGNITGYGFIQDGFPLQQETVRIRGSQNQFSLAYGGNYDDTFYFGAALNVQTLDYSRFNDFRENDYLADEQILENLRTTEFLNLSGVGVSGTFGAVFRPIDLVRFGITYTTPITLNIDRETGFDLETIYDGTEIVDPIDSALVTLDGFFTESPVFISEYRLKLPSRLNLGTAFFLSKNGFISIDAEYVNFSNSSIQSSDFPVEADNQTINNIYRSVWNFRFGGEYRVNFFRLRAGYGMQANPNRLLDDIDADVVSYSGGVGVKFPKFGVDFTYRNQQWSSIYSPYGFDELDITTPSATIDHSRNQYLLTIGVNF